MAQPTLFLALSFFIMITRIRALAQQIRWSRSWHRRFGLFLFVFISISSLTGILLAWKKDIAVLQPPSQKGSKQALTQALPLAELQERATVALKATVPNQDNNTLDRMDVRPDKGIVKCLFEQGYWEVQLDLYDGSTLSVAQRHSDWIEQLHDGSLIADWFKLLSMNLLGLGLLFLGGTGLWLWYGPKKIRRLKKQ